MILKIFLFLLAIATPLVLSAQDSTNVDTQQRNQAPEEQKIYYGGNIGASIGSYTRIGIYPLIGYKLTPKLSAGVKLGYEYIRDNRYSSTYNASNYGASVFARYRLIPQLYAHVEYAGLNYELYNALGESSREWVPFLLIGGGYSQPIGPRTWLNIEVLFDVLQNDRSPYSAWYPFVNVGVGVGF